jgi:hypothetical protein
MGFLIWTLVVPYEAGEESWCISIVMPIDIRCMDFRSTEDGVTVHGAELGQREVKMRAGPNKYRHGKRLYKEAIPITFQEILTFRFVQSYSLSRKRAQVKQEIEGMAASSSNASEMARRPSRTQTSPYCTPC